MEVPRSRPASARPTLAEELRSGVGDIYNGESDFDTSLCKVEVCVDPVRVVSIACAAVMYSKR